MVYSPWPFDGTEEKNTAASLLTEPATGGVL